MGADNWTYCPKCQPLPLKSAQDLAFEAAKKLYGKVSAEQYADSIAGAREQSDDPPEPTLREDYELGIQEGEFEVSYGAYCTACKFEFSFNHKQDVP